MHFKKLFTYLPAIFCGLLVTCGMLGMLLSSDNPLNTEIRSNAVWSKKAIQIEKLGSDGKWYPREPLNFDRQMFLRPGHAEPDFEMVFKLTPPKTDDTGVALADRQIRVFCETQSFSTTFDFIAANFAAWESTFPCNGSEWRMTLVDTDKVLRPEISKTGLPLPIDINRK